MNPKKANAGSVKKFRGYNLAEYECKNCRNYRGRKRGCKLDKCCRDADKLEAIAADRHRRNRGSDKWDS